MGRLVSEDLDFNPFWIPSSYVILDSHLTSSLKKLKLKLSLNFKDCYYYFHMFMNWCFWTVVLERTSRVPWSARRSNQSILEEINPSNIRWKDWHWSRNSNTLATWCEELTHWKRPWCWERLKAGGEGEDRGWDGWMASLTQWTWVWAGSGSWWWTGKPDVLQSMWSQRVGHDRGTELTDWTYIWNSINIIALECVLYSV